MRRLRPLSPGQTATNNDFNQLVSRVNALSTVNGRNGIDAQLTENGLLIKPNATGLTPHMTVLPRGTSTQTINASASSNAVPVLLKRDLVSSQGGMVLDSANNQIIVPRTGIYSIEGQVGIETAEDLSIRGHVNSFYRCNLNARLLPASIEINENIIHETDSGASITCASSNNYRLLAGDGVSMRTALAVTGGGSPLNDWELDGGLTFLTVSFVGT